jgi:hypothetical protein
VGFFFQQGGNETHLEGRIIGLFKWRLDYKFALILFVDCSAQMRIINYGMFDRCVARESKNAIRIQARNQKLQTVNNIIK